MMKLNLQTTPIATAFGMPLDSAVEKLAATATELSTAAEKTSRSRAQGFGSRIAQAVKRKTGAVVFAAASSPRAENESFGQRVKKAVEKKSRHMKTQQQHKEQSERERNRYSQPQPRKRTKGE
jgi:hypothetical protein